jgi:hypothetical protein
VPHEETNAEQYAQRNQHHYCRLVIHTSQAWGGGTALASPHHHPAWRALEFDRV